MRGVPLKYKGISGALAMLKGMHGEGQNFLEYKFNFSLKIHEIRNLNQFYLCRLPRNDGIMCISKRNYPKFFDLGACFDFI